MSTRALTPRVALILAGLANLVGALMCTEIAKTVGKGILDPAELQQHHAVWWWCSAPLSGRSPGT